MDAKQKAVIDLVLNGQQAQTSLREVTRAAITLRRELLNMRQADNPELYKQRQEAYQKILKVQQQMKAEMAGVATGWQKVLQQVGTITTGIIGADLVGGVMSQFSAAKDKVVEYKDSLADVSKATDMTTEEAQALNEQLQQIKTRTPTKELREMAVAAGQFGVAKDEVDDFVKSADKLNVAIGDQFDGAQETAGTMLTLRNTFQDIKTQRIDEDMLHIGNALNVLEADGAATGKTMADFSSRIGGVAIPMGMTTGQVIGLSASLEEMNVTAERGSTGLKSVLMGMAKAPEAVAPYARSVTGAKLSTAEFTQLVNTDLMGALMSVARGMKSGDTTATGFAAKLEEMGFKGDGVQEVLMKLASNTKLVEDKVKLASKAITETDSILAEFAKKNFQLAQDLKDLDEAFDNIYQSEGMQKFVAGAVHGTLELLKALPQAYHWIKENTTVSGLFLYAITMLNAGLIRSTLSTWANTAAQIANKAAYEIGFKWLVIQTAATSAYETVMAGATIRTRIATAAQLLWNAALRANPIGLVITAIAGLAYAVKVYSENTESALALERQKATLQRDVKKATEQNAAAIKDLTTKTSRYNELSKEEQESLKKTISLKETEARMRLANAYAKAREIARSEENKPGFIDGVKQGATNLLTGNLGADLDAQQKRLAKQKQDQAYEDAKQQANVDQLKADWDAIRKIKSDVNSPAPVVSGGAGGGNPENKKDKKTRERAAKERADDEKKALDSIAELKADAVADDEKREREEAKLKRDRRLTELNESKASDATKAAWRKSIENSLLVDLGKIEEKYTEKRREEKKKQYDDDLKAAEDLIDLKKQQQLLELEAYAGAGLIDKEHAKLSAAGFEETALNAKLVLYQAHYKALEELGFTNKEREKEIARQKAADLTAIQTDITKAVGEQSAAAADINQANSKKATDREKLDYSGMLGHVKKVMDAKTGYIDAGSDAIKSIFKKNTLIYRAAMIAEKAWAIGSMTVDYTQAMMKAIKANAYLGFPAAIGAVAGQMAMPTLQLAAGIAKIKSQQFEAPAFAEGGSTAIDRTGKPAGFVKVPTLFDLGKRSYVAGEAGEEYIIPYPMLKQPAVANTVRMLEAMRTGRAYAQGGSSALGDSQVMGSVPTVGVTDHSAAMLRQLERNNELMAMLATRPMEFNYRLLKQYEDNLGSIEVDTKLS